MIKMSKITEARKSIKELMKVIKNQKAYDLACALRGNDFSSYGEIKYLFTGRIRYYLGVEEGDSMLVIREIETLKKWERDDVIEELKRMKKEGIGVHYFRHILLALDALADIDVMPLPEYDNLKNICMKIVDYLNSEINSDGERNIIYQIGILLDKMTVKNDKKGSE